MQRIAQALRLATIDGDASPIFNRRANVVRDGSPAEQILAGAGHGHAILFMMAKRAYSGLWR